MEIEHTPVLIAYAEDLDLVRRSISEHIKSDKRFKLSIEASNGQELLDKIALADSLPDICILDINMPVMNGYDTLLKIRNTWPGIKSLVLTMYDEPYCVIRMLKNGANGFLTKSENAEELVKALISIHRDGFYYSDTILPEYAKNRDYPDLDQEQIEALAFFGSDMSDLEIANKMDIDILSVHKIMQQLTTKLHITSRVGLFLFAQRTGLVPLS